MLRILTVAALIATLAACGGGGSDSPPAPADNSARQAAVERDIGYSGGNVEFGGQKIVGEWSTKRTLNLSGARDAFKSTDKYLVTGVRFEPVVGYSEYWLEFLIVAGKTTTNAAWTPVGIYGVNKDATLLTIDKGGSEKKTYLLKGATPDKCLDVLEQETGDKYAFCKTAG